MLTLPSSVRVFLAVGPVDMRRGHDGLLALVRGQLGLDPYLGHIVIFFSRRRDRVKLLYWDRGGFVLVYKRLERARFRPPEPPKDATQVELDGSTLSMLLEGIDVTKVRRPKRWNPPQSIDRPIGDDPQV